MLIVLLGGVEVVGVEEDGGTVEIMTSADAADAFGWRARAGAMFLLLRA